MKITEEKITIHLLEELEPLLKINAEETGIKGKFQINKLVYIKANAMGAYSAFTVRNKEGVCVGYAGYAIIDHLYFPEYKMGQQDSLYLREDYRVGSLGIKLLKYCEKVLKEKYEVNLILQHSTVKRDLSNLFTRLGYSKADTIFAKEI